MEQYYNGRNQNFLQRQKKDSIQVVKDIHAGITAISYIVF